jgi:hypothetical protein
MSRRHNSLRRGELDGIVLLLSVEYGYRLVDAIGPSGGWCLPV